MCSHINEALHAKPGQAGQSALERRLYIVWAKSALSVIESGNTAWRKKWGGFLRGQGVSACEYGASKTDHPYTVYIKVALNHSKCYVGSTKNGIITREGDRRRSFLNENRDRRTEPAFEWW